MPEIFVEAVVLDDFVVVVESLALQVFDQIATTFEWITHLAIALLFFMHGAKLSRQAILAGAGHWRLHLLVFACTFILFPLLGLALRPALEPLLGKELYLGMLYLCALPATVQSAIAFTSLARGNIPAAICSAAASSLLGIFVTPLLVALLMGVQGDNGSTLDAIGKISLQLLLPFVLGQIAQRWIGGDYFDLCARGVLPNPGATALDELRRVLAGEAGPVRDIVLLNAAAGFHSRGAGHGPQHSLAAGRFALGGGGLGHAVAS